MVIEPEVSSSGDKGDRQDNPADSKQSDGRKPEDAVVSAGKSTQLLLEPVEDSESKGTASVADFHNNDTRVLSLLNEYGSNYSFKGIMRKLDIHQQSLSRVLHRLEEMGLVEKSEGGYRLSRGGESVAASRAFARKQQSAGVQALGRGDYIQLLQSFIPVSGVKALEIAQSLAGRWFKNLRWVGMVSGPTGYTLQWASEDGAFQVNLTIVSDYIIIETNAGTEREKASAMLGSYAIYEQIVRLLQSRVGGEPQLGFRATGPFKAVDRNN